MQRDSVTSPGVLIRDVLIFQLKLLLDAFKDVVLFKVAIIAAAVDLVLLQREPAKRFYTVLRLSERFDLWLNLNGAAQRADQSDDGLFGASLAGSDSLLGKLEELIRSKVETAAASARR
ncbi:MAG: hypothetical protein DIU52_012910 [bacterium]|jgi:hypothetical protein|nr:MAG: hypothetical protein DIU52_14330 [bacterium]